MTVSDELDIPEPDVSEEHPVSEHWIWVGTHRPPSPRVLFEQMTSDWAPEEVPNDVHPGAAHAAKRRTALAARFPDRTIVVPTGNFKVRANDTDYRFRPGSDFFYLTGSDEPDAVLVITPGDPAHATLYIPHRRDASTHEFYTDSRYGELWVGARRGVAEAAIYYDIETAALEDLAKILVELDQSAIVTLRGFDAENRRHHRTVRARLRTRSRPERDATREGRVRDRTASARRRRHGEGLRRRRARSAERDGRGERVVEGVFNLRARVEGNDVGYDTIAASGAHATTLHWIRNSGSVKSGDLLLLDAGVEGHSSIPPTSRAPCPISGTYSPAQRRIYDLVYEAQSAGIAAVRPGAKFMDPHDAAMEVLAEGSTSSGILKEEPE